MDFQFVIPRESSELLNSNGNYYFVNKIFSAQEIPEKLKSAKNDFLNSGVFFIFDHFDTFFSIIETGNQASLLTINRASDLLFLAIDKLGRSISTQFSSKPASVNETQNDAQSAEAFDRESFLNMVKMLMYLNVNIVRTVDRIFSNQEKAANANSLTTTNKNSKKVSSEIEYLGWQEKRYKLLLQLYNVFQLPLEKLWSLCIAEEDFVNLICDTAYNTMLLMYIREKRVGDIVFQIIGTAIKRYNHALIFPVRIQQIIRDSEMAVIPCAHGMNTLYTEFGITTIYAVVLKNMVDAMSVDLADAQTTRHFGMFLAEIGALHPTVLLPHLSQMGEELLNLDSYVMRNCVLQIMSDTILSDLSSEELSDEYKEMRDEFLEDLFMHIIDVSAHVRSKTLQLWSHLRAQCAVPLTWQHKVLQAAAERLEDKGTLVRKNAVLLIKSFLETNPFSAKLPLKELHTKYESEAAKLQEIRDKMIEVERIEEEMNAKWQEMADDVLVIINDELVKRPNRTPGVQSAEAKIGFAKKIMEMIIDNKIAEAFELVRQFDSNDAEIQALSIEHRVQYYAVLLRSYLFLNKDHTEEYTTQAQTVKFLEDSIKFAEVMSNVVPVIENMMQSKINSDVFEAIDFFTTAYLFGIKETEEGMRKMLFLVWSGDKEKREAVSRAYHRVLFVTDQEGRAHKIQVVANLCNLFEGITRCHYSALEVLTKEWIDNDDIDNHIIQVLFEKITKKIPDTSDNSARLSLQLLVTAANIRPSIASANFDLIQTIAFRESGKSDPRVFALCLDFLCCTCNVENDRNEFYRRYELDSDLIMTAINCFEHFFFHPSVTNSDNVTISTLDFLYQMCSTPDLVCQTLVNSICVTSSQLVDKTDVNEVIFGPTTISVPGYVAPRILHLMGYLAVKELVFLDIDIYSNMKYRQELADQLKKNKKKNKNGTNVDLDVTADARRLKSAGTLSASKALKRLSESATEVPPDADDLLEGASAEDSNAELILHLCESSLYAKNGIMHNVVPVIQNILQHPGKYSNQRLQQAASLCLVRFMVVSSQFCEENMPFLMNLLQLTQNVRIKCNIMVGLSDIMFRFPNVVQSWTSHIYATLHEENDEIRLTSVKMLSHLIQHEMIRVKGQISDLAICLVDRNADIRQLTMEFFKVIAQKSNILYNVLPDIISRLSGAHANLAEEQYHIIMRYVIGLIQKDRQVESLVEKLCLRFKVTQEKRQWRDIAFCLSLLTYNEKTIKKLIEHIPNFKDKVQEDEIHDYFKTIIANSARQAKPDFKVLISDFEAKLEECLVVNSNPNGTGGEDDENIENAEKRLSSNAMPPPKKIPSKKGAARQQKKPSRANRRRANSNSDDSDEDAFEEKTRPAANKARPSRKAASSQPIESDSSSSEDETTAQKRKRKHR